MNLQPLYDVKERLEYAAVAGTGLVGEDFRLRRALEALTPLAGASPVLAKIAAGLEKLLAAPAEGRSSALLDLLALVDAVAYTQAKTGAEGELEPLPQGGGTCRQIPWSQLQPLLNALTTTGGGRLELIESVWESHPEFFSDFRVLPAVVSGLGDSYGEIAERNAKILRSLGPAALPLLKRDFDPAGKRDMVRRVEVIAALEGAGATPWLREVLSQAKKDVRAAVISALGGDGANTALLLELAGSERGKNREAALGALARQEGESVRAFWTGELAKNSTSADFLESSETLWASDLAAAGLGQRLAKLEEALDAGQEKVSREDQEDLERWLRAARGKSSPAMLELWRWADGRLERFGRLKNHISQPYPLAGQLSECLLRGICETGAAPLAALAEELHGRDPKRAVYLPHAFAAASLTRPASEVYGQFSPYLLTKKPLLDSGAKRSCHEAMLAILLRLRQGLAGPLDRRWALRLLEAAWRDLPGKQTWYPSFPGGAPLGSFEATLTGLMDPADPEHCRALSAYFRRRMVEAADWYTYGRLVLRCGGSPRGALEEALGRSVKTYYLYHIWDFCAEAARTLPPEETAAILGLFARSKCVRREDVPQAQRALPWTAERLRAGEPFPEWRDWWKMR